jgi:competence protein ComEA
VAQTEAAVRGLSDRPPTATALSGKVLAGLNPGRRAVKALAAVAVAVVVIAAFLAWHSQPHAEVIAASASPSAVLAAGPPQVAPTPAPPSPSASTIVVAISGRVKRPGLVHLPPGARVADAIAAAGGALPGTDLSFVNLARKVADGELIVIGVAPSPGTIVDGAGGADDPSAAASGGLVDINTATESQLDTLPGIGPALAQRIIDYRTQHGSFHSVNELQQVPGIGDAKFAEIKDLVTI